MDFLTGARQVYFMREVEAADKNKHSPEITQFRVLPLEKRWPSVCVCVYTCIYIYVYTHTHIHTHVCMCTYICLLVTCPCAGINFFVIIALLFSALLTVAHKTCLWSGEIYLTKNNRLK